MYLKMIKQLQAHVALYKDADSPDEKLGAEEHKHILAAIDSLDNAHDEEQNTIRGESS